MALSRNCNILFVAFFLVAVKNSKARSSSSSDESSEVSTSENTLVTDSNMYFTALFPKMPSGINDAGYVAAVEEAGKLLGYNLSGRVKALKVEPSTLGLQVWTEIMFSHRYDGSILQTVLKNNDELLQEAFADKYGDVIFGDVSLGLTGTKYMTVPGVRWGTRT
uniref:Uncharacterized protein n=1 Tax=Tetraselmis sp. GSL018 TaxID=582737 RepID=A0A061SBR8_9CHLO|eukprot:CAMPEP_0177596148 /NCGR_PEP_ID=MMETSP0419_2-20121207/10843_1 /TAXON_ID=582737 /ORGANISM="Tetraselmis sp., Strain GSL018" /LENGTH=163 /DNA_ID=CAMNT_0019087871 /DNA_START=187 /DNA_END=678 /DNA_ORIENTATION=-